MTLTLGEFLTANPDIAEALRAYRAGARAYLLDTGDRRRGIRRARRAPHWTVVLFNDFSVAGPRSLFGYGFGRDQWPPLQTLRNSGVPFKDGFADQIDAVLDAAEARA